MLGKQGIGAEGEVRTMLLKGADRQYDHSPRRRQMFDIWRTQLDQAINVRIALFRIGR
ncbi:MAG: hypothetical protein Kow0074_05470 [Candidatus Zixiibacteriota bacterium]